jgi:Tripartite tricarboxylate transporter TctB family
MMADRRDEIGERTPRSTLASLPAIVAWCLAAVFAVVVVVGRGYPPDARLFPTIVATIGLLLCAIFLGASALSPAYASRNIADMEAISGDGRAFRVACIAPFVYSVGIYVLGFYLSTLAAMLVMPPLLGYRDWKRLVAIAVGVVVLLHLVFVVAVEIELPNGLLGDYLVTRFLHDD